MRIYISLDMEGMPGTWNWEQEKRDRNSVKKAIYNHTKDVIEAILGSVENSKISEIIIADSHGMGDNLDYEITALDKRISLVSGSPRPFYMMPAFDKDISAVIFLGYHAGSGAAHGNMDHTYSNSRVHRLWINDIPMNEAFINAAYAGHYDIPVVLITGDQTLKEELQNTPLSEAEYVVTKQSIAKFAAMNYSMLKVQEELKEKVKIALQKIEQPLQRYKFTSPITLKILFNSSSMADVAALVPCTTRLDGRTIAFTHNDYAVVFETIVALTTIAYTVNP
ncbi:MAG: M55 family metallopeptidase [Candidatus Cloacimonetes bacterium]|nr:M55 family metallopeptidase [Candidatus Cloacimonadota bacterium]